ncbi:hypothetical protein FKM82_017783 [Ascaphus truei]
MEYQLLLNKYGYELGKILGKGTYSTVREAFSQKLSMTVAIKIIDKSKCSPDYVSKFLPRELSILTQCYHPNITAVFEIMESSDGRVFLIMEKAQVWTTDLKCENILMTSDNIPKLSDFGFAVSLNGNTLSATFCGSPVYAAPKILQGKSYDAMKADILSLGVMLYLLVTGYMPFDDTDLTKLLQFQNQPLEFPSSRALSDSCRDIISSMLSINPNERPTVHQILEYPWISHQLYE